MMRTPKPQSGLTLIELMVAITISLIVLAALTAMFVTSSRARDEITRANQQLENGRYAMQVLSDELRMAGYWGGADVRDIVDPLPPEPPDACYVPSPLPTGSNDTAATSGTPDNLEDGLAVHVQGYDNGLNPNDHCDSTGDFGADEGLLTGYKDNTDVLVIRRASSCTVGEANCNNQAGELYFQASMCNDQLETGPSGMYRLSTNTFDRETRACDGTTMPRRRYLTHIFYIDNSSFTNDAGDAIPTLVRAELQGGNFNTKVPIAEGIEEIQYEYGIDNAPATRDGIPDVYTSAPTDAQWPDVTAVKVFLLARSTDPSPGHDDSGKSYTLGTNAPISPGGNYKRHVFETLVHLSNPAGLRQ